MSARIVIAEDDGVMRKMLSLILSRAGYRVVAVADGQSAFELVLRDGADLIVADLQMPGLGGAELIRELAAVSAGAPPVAVLTASALEADASLARTAGAAAFLTKPVGSADLLAIVERLLAREAVAV